MDARMETGTGFYRSIVPFERFSGVVVPGNYHALPGDWIIGVADVVDLTGVIAAGRYKAVNMVGAGVVSALRNALGETDFPFCLRGRRGELRAPLRAPGGGGSLPRRSSNLGARGNGAGASGRARAAGRHPRRRP